MKQLYKLYIILGLNLRKFVLPIFRLVISRTTRVYVIIKIDDEILMTKNWLGNGLWALPGGGLSRKENPKQAAVRELREELGLSLNEGSLVFVESGKWASERLNFKYIIYATNALDRDFKRNKRELTHAEWLKPDQLYNNTTVEILKALNMVEGGKSYGKRGEAE
jgi:8-oxo-dGTP pyrophosphatase MutT (NUDIX family)